MTMLFVALNGMISVLALPVSNENDHSHGVQSQAQDPQGPRKTLLNSRSDPPDQRSPMDQWDGLASASILHPSTDIYLGPGDSGIWPSTGVPRQLPPVAIPPSFPPGAQVELYKRMEGVHGHEVLSFGEKLDRLKQFDWFWSSIDPTTRHDELRNSGTVCAKLERKKLVNAYLILLYKITDVVAQIRWIKQTPTYRRNNKVKSTCDESIKRVEESIRVVEEAKGLRVSQSASPEQWLVLEPDDMIVLGLADPREQFDGKWKIKAGPESRTSTSPKASMAHSHSHSNSNPIFIILTLGTALSSIALAAPLHPDPGSTLSVMMRRELEDHFAGIDNNFLSSSCSFATHAPLARLAGCLAIDCSQMLPESLLGREDDVNEPDDVHRLIFPSSSSGHPMPLPTPGLTARGVMIQQQPPHGTADRDASQQAEAGGSSAAPAADANPESPPSQDAIVSETVEIILNRLSRDKLLWTVDTVYIELKPLKSWYPDMYKADGDMDRFQSLRLTHSEREEVQDRHKGVRWAVARAESRFESVEEYDRCPGVLVGHPFVKLLQ
ncbi:hypothetical protein C8R42DRAFT_644058 [Lentinula raphanica]|nr:hypothetical protein C8R42DRAFT_644058 [Lentinula raphanica]